MAPFPVAPELAREIETLGRVLLQFYRAANLLYRRSVEGKAPGWVAAWLDQGKPAEVVALQRDPAFKSELPRVIRPDLLVTEHGLVLTELDSVPGGIGLTTWLHETYESVLPVPLSGPESQSDKAGPLFGSAHRMKEGFSGIFGDAPSVHIVVSEESATYRPEMEWLAGRSTRVGVGVRGPDFTDWKDGEAVYRFFEMFDLENVAAAWPAFEAARSDRIRVTPPPKPFLEEKSLLALLWNRNLHGFWRQELGEGFLRRLLELVPYTWVMDFTPLPPQGAFPELGLTDWTQLKGLSQRERDLILKVSGFSERAWGARGVALGSDLSAAEWAAAIDGAQAAWPRSVHVLQRYHKPVLVDVEWYDFKREAVVPMPGRARLCPYYFVQGEGDSLRAHFGGVLATTCPADKKIIHGMREAVLAPCVVAQPA